jgi:hypothetical protein
MIALNVRPVPIIAKMAAAACSPLPGWIMPTIVCGPSQVSRKGGGVKLTPLVNRLAQSTLRVLSRSGIAYMGYALVRWVLAP